MSDMRVAKKYLEDRPFKVSYFIRGDRDDDIHLNVAYFEEYPDYIPKKEESVVFKNNVFIVVHTLYRLEYNTLEILLEDQKKYLSRGQKRRYED